LLAWLVSTIAMAGIILILKLYDDQLLSHWPLTIKLNTFISVLSQISQTALMMPVSGCISQLKWLWYIEPMSSRTLADFGAIDDASRGPWASLLLVWKTRAQ
jgi:hypothetical protein